jgi:hypothetical protein
MEHWRIGRMGLEKQTLRDDSFRKLAQYSNIPSFQYSRLIE